MWEADLYKKEFNFVQNLKGDLDEFEFEFNYENEFVQKHKVKGKPVAPGIFIIDAVCQAISKIHRLNGLEDYYSILTKIYSFTSKKFVDGKGFVFKIKILKKYKKDEDYFLIAEAKCEKSGTYLKIGLKLYKNVYS